MNTFKYLGHMFGASEVEKPNITNLCRWLHLVGVAPLKPDQRMEVVSTFVIPKLLYGLQDNRVTPPVLIWLRPRQTIYCAGDLGIAELSRTLPFQLLGRYNKLLEKTRDPHVSRVLQTDRMVRIVAECVSKHSPSNSDEKVSPPVL